MNNQNQFWENPTDWEQITKTDPIFWESKNTGLRFQGNDFPNIKNYPNDWKFYEKPHNFWHSEKTKLYSYTDPDQFKKKLLNKKKKARVKAEKKAKAKKKFRI